MTTILCSLPHLVDLSLGTPASGTVNFNVLHALLHAIVQILNTDNVRVELSGTQLCKPENFPKEDKECTLTLNEYEIEAQGKRTLIMRPPREVDKIFVVKKWSTGDEAQVSKTIDDAQSKVADAMVSEVKTPTEVPAKVTALVTNAKLDPRIDQRIMNIEERIKKLEGGIIDVYNRLPKIDPTSASVSLKEFEAPPPANEARNKAISPKGKIQQEQIFLKSIPYSDTDQIAAITEDIKNINNEISQIKSSLNLEAPKDTGDSKKLKRGKVERLEEREENEEPLVCAKFEKTVSAKIEEFTTKFIHLTDEILDIEKNLSTLSYQLEELSRPKGKAEVCISDILKELMVIKGKIQTVMSETSFLMTERERIKASVDTVIIGLDDVQRNKVDRDEIDELLAEKADFNMLQRKVSMDEFDASKRDYNHNFIEAITAMDTRHDNLYTEFQSLRSFIDTKVNQEEIKDIKMNIERRCQVLNSKIEAILAQKDPEAAGTRNKILRDVNCISCTQKVLMRTEEDNLPRKAAVPGHRSIKPFLTYELDTVRKQIKEVGTSRNLHHYESMLKDTSIITDPKARQMVMRYCGGSHTIITPQDRVDRGRCKRFHGVKSTTNKCVCGDPTERSSEKPRVKNESSIKQIKEPDICLCPSEEDPLQKCMSSQVKRCLEIDARRREICKLEKEQKFQSCKDMMEGNQKYLNEQDKYRTVTDTAESCRERRIDKSALCKDELEKYKKCQEYSKPIITRQKEYIDKDGSEPLEKQQESPLVCSKTNMENKNVQLAYHEESPQEENSYEKTDIIRGEIADLECPYYLVEESLSDVDKSE